MTEPRTHRAPHQQPGSGRSSAKPRQTRQQAGYGAQWQRLRKLILLTNTIDGIVVCTTPGCRNDSRTHRMDVDHIVPKARGGDDARTNLQVLCQSCHSRKTTLEQDGNVTPGLHHATLVCGPVGSGRMDYVDARRVWGDLVCDMDGIVASLSRLPLHDRPACILPFAVAATRAIESRWSSAHDVRHAWFVSGLPKPAERHRVASRLNADVVVLRVSTSAIQRRLQRDERRAKRAETIANVAAEWWSAYGPHDDDTTHDDDGNVVT